MLLIPLVIFVLIVIVLGYTWVVAKLDKTYLRYFHGEGKNEVIRWMISKNFYEYTGVWVLWPIPFILAVGIHLISMCYRRWLHE